LGNVLVECIEFNGDTTGRKESTKGRFSVKIGLERWCSLIIKVRGGYEVKSHTGKNLGGPYRSKAQAEKRLKQVETFKHIHRVGDEIINGRKNK
jgi:hypothetical protein